MAGGRVGYCGRDSKMSSALLRNLKVPCPSQQFDSPFLPGPSSSFLGKRSIVSFADVDKGNRWDRSFFRSFDQEENVDDEWDEYFQQTEKKRRLTADQIQFLERSFEADNKLEPERKIQLAKELGLQPRQIAIWFQNRRARWKTKQLEKDYEALQASYDGLKANYDGLLKEKEKLKAQVLLLTDQLLLGQKEKESVESSVNKEQYGGPLQEPVVDSISESEVSKYSIMADEPEDLCSPKIDELGSISDSPCNIDVGHSTVIQLADSLYVFEPDHSDISQDEEDSFSKSLSSSLPYMLPKIEDTDCPDPPTNFFGYPAEDHAFGFWPY